MHWASCGRFAVGADVIDNSHVIVQLRRCLECAQRFAWVFTAFVDWEACDEVFVDGGAGQI